MSPKFFYNHFIFIFFFIFFFSLSLRCPGFLAQNDPAETTCDPSFQCANKPDITYPFWNGYATVRPRNLTLCSHLDIKPDCSWTLCGHPDFKLDCRGNAPILNISKLPYRVLDLNYTNTTLTLARNDLWNTPCYPIPLDTVISSEEYFEIPEDSGCKNISLYYNCTTSRVSPKNTIPNQFMCGSKNETMNFFDDGSGNVSTADFTCQRKIVVPVNESALELIQPVSSPLLALSRVLNAGFTIKWFADDTQCRECERKSGTCVYVYDQFNGKLACQLAGPRRPNPRDRRTAPASAAVDSTTQVDGSPKNTSLPPNPNRKEKVFKSTRLKLGVLFGSLGFTLAVVVISWLCKRQHCPSAPKNPHIENFLLQHGSLAPKRYRYSEIKKITKSFSDKLGQGGYGRVYKGMLPNGSLVAIKVLFETDSNDEEFINEVASISRTSHVNVVSLLGFCYERNKRALVYEFMPNNSLDKLINDASKGQDMEIMYTIAVGVAKGLEYLHKGCSTSIIHFDIKPQNILLDDGFNPKISDFGLAKLCKKRQSILSMPGTRGTAGYIAPEVFSRNFGGVSHKSDVYSYGIMVLEMAGAQKFMEAQEVQSTTNYFPDKIYTQVVEFGHVMKHVDYDESVVQQGDERVRKMLLVGFWCMQTMPSDRLPMSKVLEMLEGSLESIPIPPKPFLFNPNQMAQELRPSAEYGSTSMTYNTMETSKTYTTTTTSREGDMLD